MLAALSRNNLPTLLVIALAYVAVYLNTQGFMALLPLVRAEFDITSAQAGLYSSFFFLSATVIAIFSGRLIDTLGARKGMVLGAGVVGLMTIVHSFSPLYALILGLAFFTGIGFSIITPSINKAVLEVAEPSRRGFSMGIAHGGGGLGGFVGSMLLPFFGEMFGWRPVLMVAGILAIGMSLLILRFYRGAASAEPDSNPGPGPEQSSCFWSDLRTLLQHRYLVCVFIMGLLLGGNISSVIGHYSLFLHLDLDYTPALAGVGLALVHVGGVVGQPIWGWLIESFLDGDRRRGLMLLGLLASGLTLFFGLVVGPMAVPVPAVVFLSFLLGFCVYGIKATYFTAVGEVVPQTYVGMVTGISLIFSRIAFVVAPPLFGLAADLTGAYATSWILLSSASLVLVLAFGLLSRNIPCEDRVWGEA